MFIEWFQNGRRDFRAMVTDQIAPTVTALDRGDTMGLALVTL